MNETKIPNVIKKQDPSLSSHNSINIKFITKIAPVNITKLQIILKKSNFKLKKIKILLK